jgi:hypothetical protein
MVVVILANDTLIDRVGLTKLVAGTFQQADVLAPTTASNRAPAGHRRSHRHDALHECLFSGEPTPERSRDNRLREQAHHPVT